MSHVLCGGEVNARKVKRVLHDAIRDDVTNLDRTTENSRIT
jgi:hypothetical protein